MVNQKLYIINLSNFYDIISELKEHVGYEISKFDNNTKNKIKKYLNLILNSNPSTDVFEVISKSLN